MQRDHEQVVELLPWYVNGTLAGSERAAIEKHMRECLPCRAALREEEKIRGLVRAQDDVPLGAGHGMASLFRRIDNRGSRAASFWARPQFGVGVTVAIVCVAVTGWFVLNGPTVPEPGVPATAGSGIGSAAPFGTLSDDEELAPNRIDIVFVDSTTEAEIRDIIESLGARLVGGPSDIGRYTVAVQVTSDAELSEVIARFSADARVRFAGRSYTAPAEADREIP